VKYFKELLKNIDPVLLALPLVFAAISMVILESTAWTGELIFTRTIKVQLAAFAIGLVLIFLIMLFDYKSAENKHWVFYVFSILFLLAVFIPGIGSEQYGARAWLDFGVIYLQPVEVVKLTFIIAFAGFLNSRQDLLHSLSGLLLIGLYIAPVLGIVIILQNDLGNALVFVVVAFVMIFVAGVDGKLYAKVTGAGIAAMPLLYFFAMSEHQKQRIDAFLHPQDMSLPGNYQIWQSKVAIGSGGFFGKGLFQGTQKELKWVPVRDSDFVFSVIVEEFGFLGGGVVIALYGLFLCRIFKIARNAKERFGSLIVFGIFAMFLFQIFENIGMTMGLMPVTGITLPFISAGGSSVVTNMIALGIVLNICIRSKVINF
jgi:rod shape determining protein RodA